MGRASKRRVQQRVERVTSSAVLPVARVRQDRPVQSSAGVQIEHVDQGGVDVVAELRRLARRREAVELATARAVALGREAGLSWDALGAALSTPGETVRRRHGRGLLSP